MKVVEWQGGRDQQLQRIPVQAAVGVEAEGQICLVLGRVDAEGVPKALGTV